MTNASPFGMDISGIRLPSNVITRGKVIIIERPGHKLKATSANDDDASGEKRTPQTKRARDTFPDRDSPSEFHIGDVGGDVDMIDAHDAGEDNQGKEEASLRDRTPDATPSSSTQPELFLPTRPSLPRAARQFSFTGQMNRIAYHRRTKGHHAYRQYLNWQPRPARRAPRAPSKRKGWRIGHHRGGVNQEIEAVENQLDNFQIRDHDDDAPNVPFSQGIDSLQTPVQRPLFGLPTPSTNRKYSPNWQSTTASQVGDPCESEDEGEGPYYWENSVLEARSASDLPQRSHIKQSIT